MAEATPWPELDLLDEDDEEATLCRTGASSRWGIDRLLPEGDVVDDEEEAEEIRVGEKVTEEDERDR